MLNTITNIDKASPARGKVHVGEVQVSLWDQETLAACEAAGVKLL